jgi:uncharacterized protein YjbI with pentapeptide repeats
MESSELAQILNAHRLWLNSNGHQGQQAKGKRDFCEKDLTGAQLSKAVLTNSNFTKAILKDANLTRHGWRGQSSKMPTCKTQSFKMAI